MKHEFQEIILFAIAEQGGEILAKNSYNLDIKWHGMEFKLRFFGGNGCWVYCPECVELFHRIEDTDLLDPNWSSATLAQTFNMVKAK